MNAEAPSYAAAGVSLAAANAVVDRLRAAVEQGLEVGPLAGDEDTDQRILPITVSPGAGSATTAHQPMPRLNTRRSSSSGT